MKLLELYIVETHSTSGSLDNSHDDQYSMRQWLSQLVVVLYVRIFSHGAY